MIDLNTPIPFLRPLELHPVEENGQQFYILRDPHGFSEKSIALSSEVVPIIASFDNKKTLNDIAEEISLSVNEKQDPNELVPLVDMLDEMYFLQNERFETFRLAKIKEFAKLEVRKAALAGIGYPENKKELETFLSNVMKADNPEDFEPEQPDDKAVLKGYLAPHIDYHRGGASYGRLYRSLNKHFKALKDKNPLFIIFGVAHAGAISPVIATGKDFETPLGKVQTNRSSFNELLANLGNGILREEWLHKYEHSLELQILWIKYLMKDKKFSILPILVGMWDVDENKTISKDPYFSKVVDTFKLIEEDHNGPVLFVSSVDFAHFGPAFGDPDLVDEKDISRIEKIDMEALKAVRNVDSDLWWEKVNEEDNPNRICGLNATTLSLALLKGSRGFIQDYDKSLSEDKSTLVTYASSMFFNN